MAARKKKAGAAKRKKAAMPRKANKKANKKAKKRAKAGKKVKMAAKSKKAAKTPVKKTKKAAAPARKTAPKKTVGEGDYAASRSFLKDQTGFVQKNKARIGAMGQEAEQALEGPEGAALREAEATAAARSRDIF